MKNNEIPSHNVIHTFIQQRCIEFLLCTRQCARCWQTETDENSPIFKEQISIFWGQERSVHEQEQ